LPASSRAITEAEFCCSGRAGSGRNRFVAEALKVHARRFSDFTYAHAAERRSAGGKTAARNRVFNRSSSKLNYLHAVVMQLKRLAAALRRTTGKTAASSFAT
jgi:hypothetical protein